MQNFFVKVPFNTNIQGGGNSIWGKSNDLYQINQITIEIMYFDNDNYAASLEVFGKNTNWSQYTDRKIEKEVNTVFKGIIEEKTGKKVKKIGWSEQGMQPKLGWNFDIIFKD
jgi:hypothetical protein